MIEIGIRGGISHAINRHAKANNKYIKNYYKIKESSYIQYLDASNLYEWEMSQKLSVDGFEWIDTSFNYKNFNRSIKLIKNYEEESDGGI